MKGLPSIRKKFFDLLSASEAPSASRRVLLRAMAAGLSLLSLGPSSLPAEMASPPAQAAVIENRSRRSSFAKLVLRLGNARDSMLASHGSHSSHASHSSHTSHASHYSSSSGSGASAPEPSSGSSRSEPASPQGNATKTPSSLAGVPPEAVDPAHQVRIEITGIDRQKRKLTGKDEYGTEFVFFYEPQSRLRTGVAGAVQLERHMGNESQPFPLRLRQHVTVAWKPGEAKRLVVLITTE
jgi:hypothetical protein